MHNTFQIRKHNSIIIQNTFQYSQHISKFETQFDNCPQHISTFTTHFNIHNTFQYSQHIFEHFNGNIGERRYWSEMVRSNAAIFMNEENKAFSSGFVHCARTKCPKIISIFVNVAIHCPRAVVVRQKIFLSHSLLLMFAKPKTLVQVQRQHLSNFKRLKGKKGRPVLDQQSVKPALIPAETLQ